MEENKLMKISDSVVTKQTFMEIKAFNEETIEYGLKLSDEDIKTILRTRSESLRNNGRVEFGGAIIKNIIEVFCDSPYISQYNYLETLDELIEIFYYYKNETLDFVGDDELIEIMKNYFDNECQGSLEQLRDKYLDSIAHNIKYGVKDYLKIDDKEEDQEEDEQQDY
ncbi:hypothetical protein D3C76_1124160 [compost metagenome]